MREMETKPKPDDDLFSRELLGQRITRIKEVQTGLFVKMNLTMFCGQTLD